MNIHALASSVLTKKKITVETFVSKSLNDKREYETVYSDPVDVIVNIQAVPRSVYERDGLDFQKKYINIFTDYDIKDLERDKQPDRLTVNGESFQALSATDWQYMAGFKQILAVRI